MPARWSLRVLVERHLRAGSTRPRRETFRTVKELPALSIVGRLVLPALRTFALGRQLRGSYA